MKRHPAQIIKRPLLTEKGTAMNEEDNKVLFEVALDGTPHSFAIETRPGGRLHPGAAFRRAHAAGSNRGGGGVAGRGAGDGGPRVD